MSNESNEGVSRQAVSRRMLVRTASWAVPSVAVAAASPAYATSTPPKKDDGLQGWVNVHLQCDIGYLPTVSIQSRGEYPEGGLWVKGVPKGQNPEDAKITFYFPADLDLDWKSRGAQTWSLLERDASAPPIKGYTAWTTRYSGGWHRSSDQKAMVANDIPLFDSCIVNLQNGSCPSPLHAYALRTVTVDGKVISFKRKASVEAVTQYA